MQNLLILYFNFFLLMMFSFSKYTKLEICIISMSKFKMIIKIKRRE